MSWLGKVFGGDSVVSKGIGLIDSAFYTDEEKAEEKRQLLKAYEPFKLAQRYIAFALIAYVLLLGVICSFLIFIGIDQSVKTVIDFNERVIFDNTLLKIIVGFYFLGGTISSMKKS